MTLGTLTSESAWFGNLNTEKLQIKGNPGLTQGQDKQKDFQTLQVSEPHPPSLPFKVATRAMA